MGFFDFLKKRKIKDVANLQQKPQATNNAVPSKKDSTVALGVPKAEDTVNTTADNTTSSNMVTVEIKSLDRYVKGAILDIDTSIEISNAIMEGRDYIEISQCHLDDMERRKLIRIKEDELLSKCCELNNKGTEYEKEGEIKLAISTYEKNILHDCYPARHSFKRLMILYRKGKDFDNEIRVINRAIEVFPKEIEYINRLAKLKGSTDTSAKVLPNSAQKYKIESTPLGVLFVQAIKKLPEFNFYADLQEDETTLGYLHKNKHLINDGKYKSEIWRIQSEFKALIGDAENCEAEGCLDEAAKIYERLISEQYYMPTPYDRLIKIYSKAKLRNEEIRVLEYSITFFTELRNTQKVYVTYLANKYGKIDFASDRINNNKKISYYGGAFELYSPYTIIST